MNPGNVPVLVSDPRIHTAYGKFAYGFNLNGRVEPDAFENRPQPERAGVAGAIGHGLRDHPALHDLDLPRLSIRMQWRGPAVAESVQYFARTTPAYGNPSRRSISNSSTWEDVIPWAPARSISSRILSADSDEQYT